MALDGPFVELNRASTERIRALAARLTDEELRWPVGEHWTVAITLAHLAFWDRRVMYVLDMTERDGKLWGDYEAALRADERALDVRETPDGLIRLGDHARAAGDHARAARAYREALAEVSVYTPAAARLGELLRETGDTAGARAAFAAPKVPKQDLTDWSWRELNPVPVASLAVGDGLDFGYVGGVYPAEEIQGAAARWTNGLGMLRLRRPEISSGGLLRLRLAAPHPDRSAVNAEVCADGQCTSIELAPTWRTYRVPLDITVSDVQVVEIRSETFVAADRRRLGVLVDSAAVE